MEISKLDGLIPDIGYFHYRFGTPNWWIVETVTDFIDVSYVVGGDALYRINGEEFTVSEGDLLCIPKGTRRSAVGVPGQMPEIIATNFQWTDLRGIEQEMPLPLIRHIGVWPDIVALYKELNGEWLRRAPGYLMKSRALFLLILHRFFELILYKESPEVTDPRIKEAVKYMTEHFAEPLTVQSVAAVTGLTPVYFGALFKQVTGSTFRQYLTSIRLNYAENMLRQGGRNVNEAARDCGFPDLFYFSRIYKQYKGIPPSQARGRAHLKE